MGISLSSLMPDVTHFLSVLCDPTKYRMKNILQPWCSINKPLHTNSPNDNKLSVAEWHCASKGEGVLCPDKSSFSLHKQWVSVCPHSDLMSPPFCPLYHVTPKNVNDAKEKRSIRKSSTHLKNILICGPDKNVSCQRMDLIW